MQVRNTTKPAISVHPITAFSTYKSTELNILQILTCNLGPDRYTPSVPIITRRSCPSQQLCKSTVRKLGPSFSSAQPSAQFCSPNVVCHRATEGKCVLHIPGMDFLLRFVLITIIHSNLILLNLLEHVKARIYLV